ncbi:hypothetical protein CRX72_12315 [Pantoea sp. BRM17]|nr:hypothetical protein CRX72_12315 [Pantoea sp. BRM17]
MQATVHGRCSDFNIMTRRDSWRAEVSILQQAPQPGRHGVAYVLAGAWQYASGSRWRNGGGETREIVSFPPGAADFAWRASIATLDASGPFSLFPGVDRVITLLQGDSPLLQSGGLTHRRNPFRCAAQSLAVCRRAQRDPRYVCRRPAGDR